MPLFSNNGKFSTGDSGKKPHKTPVKSEKSASPAAPRPRRDVNDIVAPVAVEATASVANEMPASSAAAAGAAKRTANTKPKRRKVKLWVQGVLVFVIIMALTFLGLGIRRFIAQNHFRQLANEIAAADPGNANDKNSPVIVEKDDAQQDTTTEPTAPAERVIMKKYADLYVRNTEFFGWLKIDDTVIDYPVMRSFENNDEYLNANFDGEYSYAGIPFADVVCSHDSDNILIYGHNMKDGTMFASLFKYEKESFYKKHPTIMFSDLYNDYEYEILAVFYDRVYQKTDTNFKFYKFINAENEEDFDYAISQYKQKSLYDTGVDAEYGDKLISLITCSYQDDDGRFVVVARRK